MWKKLRKNYRRLIASLLTFAMVATNVGGNLTTAFAAGESENALFLVDGGELREAIREAERQGEVFDFTSLRLAAKRKSIKTRYEKLLGKKEGAVYALDLDIDDSYAPEGTELQVFYNAGTEDVIFLFLNGSDLMVDYRVNIDGYETEPVRVSPNTMNIEADGEEAPAYAENYEAADMIDDEAKKLGAEVLNPQETSVADKETGNDVSKEDGDTVKEPADSKDDSQKETEEMDASEKTEGITGTGDEKTDGTGNAENVNPEEEEEQTESGAETEKKEEVKSETEKETETESTTEAETEAELEMETEAEEVETEPEAEAEAEAEAADGELLSISRHEAALVAVSMDELEGGEETTQEIKASEEETEAETPEETEAETEADIQGDTEGIEADNDGAGTEESKADTDSENKPEESAAETESVNKPEDEETKAETGNKPEESVSGTEIETRPEESNAGTDVEEKPEESEAETGTDIIIEETKGENSGEKIPDEGDFSEKADSDFGNSAKDDGIEMEGQLLEDDDVEILGELKGKEYDTVTILDHVNAKAWKIAWEDIEAVISSEAMEYAVDYQVNIPEAAEVKGADSVVEGEDLYFAVEPEEGYEILSVYANGMELEEVEDVADLASASNWKGYSYVYVVRKAAEDLEIEVELEAEMFVVPAATYTADADDAVITVNVPEGAFEEKVDFQARKIKEGSLLEELTSQAEGAIEEDQKVEGVFAYDLTFVTMSGEEVEPSKPVDVRISFMQDAIPKELTENATAVSVVHLPEGEEPEVEATVESTDVDELEFQAESFSVRMAVFTSREAVDEEYEIVGNFAGLTNAINNINSGKTTKAIRLKESFEAPDGFPVKAGRTVKIDLNGETLTYSGNGNGFNRFFYVRGTLIIEDTNKTKTTKGTITNRKKSGFDSSFCVDEGGILKIEGGTITSKGANHGIYVKNGKVVMTGGQITGNGNANSCGGGIYLEKGSVEVKGGTIDGNTASNGGGIYTCPGTSVKVSGGVISRNNSQKNNEEGAQAGEGSGGGGIFTRGSMVMSGGEISGNHANSHGGGIYLETGSVEVEGGTIGGNTASNGGGIYACPGTSVKVSGGVISGNNSKKYNEKGAHYGEGSGGGGIFTRGSMVMSGGEISGNHAEAGGGGIYVDTNFATPPTFLMTGGYIQENTAKDEGGGIYFGWNGTITGGSFIKNETTTTFDWGGGGIFIQKDATVHITNALITGNRADGYGGGVAGCPDGNVRAFTINGAAIFDNTAYGTNITQRLPTNGKTEDQEAKKDTVFIENGYRDYYCENTSTVYGKMLGGGSAEWKGSAKQKGGKTQKITIKKGESKTADDRMGLSAEPSEEDKENARMNAKVQFLQNTSKTHGGAIMCNGTLDLGIKEDTSVKISISGKKNWNDGNDRDGKRPSSIEVLLLANGSQVESKTVTPDKNGDWNWTFSNLAKQAGGKDIKYTVKEKEVPGYTSTTNGSNITNTHIPEKIDISGKKNWQDNNDQDGMRPNTIKVRLLKNGIPTEQIKEIKVGANGECSWTFTDLYRYENGEEITYTVEEVDVAEGYEATVNGMDITNRHDPIKVNISGKKIWDDEGDRDGIRPASITVRLYENDTATNKTQTVSKDNNWSWEFENLDQYKSGKKIIYTVKEDTVPEGYEAKETGADITNTHEISRVTLSGQKTWNDDNNRDNKMPESITVRLLADDVEIASKSVSKEDGWKYSFAGYPEYKEGEKGVPIKYTIKEDPVDGYEPIYKENSYDIENKHTPEVIDISGSKTWKDEDNRDGNRPGSITVTLYADGTAVASKEVTETDEWSWTFANMPKYKTGAVGQEIRYTVQESVVENYRTSYEEKTYNIINEYTPGRTSRTVKKFWDDSENQDGIRPGAIQVQLMANDEAEGEPVILNQENGWTYTWENLYAKDNGQEIKYTVVELGKITGYTASYNEDTFIITNIHKPAEISHTVTKVWEDADNRYRRRPESIQVQLLADGKAEGEAVILNELNQWAYTWNNLPEKANGQNIQYTVQELGTVEGYTVSYSEDTFTITNTYTVPNRPGGGGGSGGGDGGNSGGGGNTPGGPGTTTIDEPGVPLANLPTEIVTELIEDPDVPLAALPKTGDNRHTKMLLMMLGIAGLGMLLSAAGLRKKEDSDD